MDQPGQSTGAPPLTARTLTKAEELVAGLMTVRARTASSHVGAYFSAALLHVLVWASVGLAATGQSAARWTGVAAACVAVVLTLAGGISKGAELGLAHRWVDAADAARAVAAVPPALTRRLVVVVIEYDSRPDHGGTFQPRVVQKNRVALTSIWPRPPLPTAGKAAGAAAAKLAATLRTAHGSRDHEQTSKAGGASAAPQGLPSAVMTSGAADSELGKGSTSGSGCVGGGGGGGGDDSDDRDVTCGRSPPRATATQLSVHEVLAWIDADTEDVVTAAVAAALTRAGYGNHPVL